MAKFKTYVSVTQEATISSNQIADIIEKEMQKILGIGGSNRWIENGWIMERDYRFGKEEIREATDEEKRKYEALKMAKEHFKTLD